MNPNLPSLKVLGVPVAQLTLVDALAEVTRLHEEAAPATVAFVNAHTLNLAAADPSYRATLCAMSLVLNDGSGLSLAARLQGEAFPANLNGTDFTPRVLELAAERGWATFFLGAKPGIAAQAAEALRQRFPKLAIVGTRDGYFGPAENDCVVEEVRASGASLLLAAMGNPVQERWLAANLARTGCRLGMAVGAYLDFAAGNVPRAPEWMRRAGVEWGYRLMQEPGRMWRRYVLGNPLFIGRIVREAISSPRRLG